MRVIRTLLVMATAALKNDGAMTISIDDPQWATILTTIVAIGRNDLTMMLDTIIATVVDMNMDVETVKSTAARTRIMMETVVPTHVKKIIREIENEIETGEGIQVPRRSQKRSSENHVDIASSDY